VATIINLGRERVTNVGATEADRSGVLSGAPAFSDEAANEAGKGLRHLVRKRHHASDTSRNTLPAMAPATCGAAG